MYPALISNLVYFVAAIFYLNLVLLALPRERRDQQIIYCATRSTCFLRITTILLAGFAVSLGLWFQSEEVVSPWWPLFTGGHAILWILCYWTTLLDRKIAKEEQEWEYE